MPFALLAIVCLAMALRLYRLDYQSLWVDEIASMNGADPDQSWRGIIDYSVSDQPPAFFLLLHGWFKIFPFDDFHGRLLSLTIGIVGIVVIFFLGKEVKNNRVGLVASLLTSISFIHILFSQEVRFYTLVFLFSTLSYLFFIRAVKTVSFSDYVLYSLSTALLLYTHYFGLVVFASQGIIFCLLVSFYSRERRFIMLSIVSSVIVILLIIPWIPIFFSDAQTENFWITREPFYFPLKYFYVFFKDVLSCFVFAGLLVIYFFNVYKNFKSNHIIDRVDLILVGGVAFGFFIPLLYSVIQTPMMHVRYMLIVLPSIIVMISVGFSFLKPRIQGMLLIATFCTSLLSLIFIEKYYTKIQKEDWRGMISDVIKKSSASDLFVSRQAWYCNYYFKSFHSELRAVLPTQFNAKNQNPSGVWWLDGFKVSPMPDAVEIDLITNGYVLKKTDSLYRARASYYQRPR